MLSGNLQSHNSQHGKESVYPISGIDAQLPSVCSADFESCRPRKKEAFGEPPAPTSWAKAASSVTAGHFLYPTSGP